MPDTQQLLEKSWAFVLAHSEKFLTFANNFADRSLQPLIAVVKSERLLYVNPLATTDISPKVLEIDTWFLGLVLLTVAHATIHRRLFHIIFYLLVGIAVEQIALRFAGTHCHGTALLMVSQCSSANSCAMYVPALYACQVCAARTKITE